MMSGALSRRRLLEITLAAQSGALAAAHQHARTASHAAKPPLRSLSAAQAREIEAIASRIIPSGATPGAREAGVIYFIDRALATFDRARRPAYREGLALAGRLRRRMFPGSRSIAALSETEQDRLVAALENTPFFELVREHTILGFLGDPAYGGNAGGAGWKLIGFEP